MKKKTCWIVVLLDRAKPSPLIWSVSRNRQSAIRKYMFSMKGDLKARGQLFHFSDRDTIAWSEEEEIEYELIWERPGTHPIWLEHRNEGRVKCVKANLTLEWEGK